MIRKLKSVALSLLLLALRPLVYFECIFLNALTGFKGGGFFLRLWLRLYAVVFGKGIYFHRPPYLFQRGNLVIGDHCSFGEFTKIWNFESVSINDEFLGAAGLTILTGGHDADTLASVCKPVVIGKRVWCGANVMIMPGVSIGDDAVVGAGAIVTKDVPDGVIVVGVPARQIGIVDMEKRREFFCSRKRILAEKGKF